MFTAPWSPLTDYDEAGWLIDKLNIIMVTAGYFYDTFAYEICFFGIYIYGIYIYGIYIYRSLKFLSIDCTVVRNT